MEHFIRFLTPPTLQARSRVKSQSEIGELSKKQVKNREGLKSPEKPVYLLIYLTLYTRGLT